MHTALRCYRDSLDHAEAFLSTFCCDPRAVDVESYMEEIRHRHESLPRMRMKEVMVEVGHHEGGGKGRGPPSRLHVVRPAAERVWALRACVVVRNLWERAVWEHQASMARKRPLSAPQTNARASKRQKMSREGERQVVDVEGGGVAVEEEEGIMVDVETLATNIAQDKLAASIQALGRRWANPHTLSLQDLGADLRGVRSGLLEKELEMMREHGGLEIDRDDVMPYLRTFLELDELRENAMAVQILARILGADEGKSRESLQHAEALLEVCHARALRDPSTTVMMLHQRAEEFKAHLTPRLYEIFPLYVELSKCPPPG